MTTQNFKALLNLAELNAAAMTPEARVQIAQAIASAAERGVDDVHRNRFAFWADGFAQMVARMNEREEI